MCTAGGLSQGSLRKISKNVLPREKNQNLLGEFPWRSGKIIFSMGALQDAKVAMSQWLLFVLLSSFLWMGNVTTVDIKCTGRRDNLSLLFIGCWTKRNHIHISEWVKLEVVPWRVDVWALGVEEKKWNTYLVTRGIDSGRDDPMCLFKPFHFPTHFPTSHAVRWDHVIEF